MYSAHSDLRAALVALDVCKHKGFFDLKIKVLTTERDQIGYETGLLYKSVVRNLTKVERNF